jgi:hypothetical protein
LSDNNCTKFRDMSNLSRSYYILLNNSSNEVNLSSIIQFVRRQLGPNANIKVVRKQPQHIDPLFRLRYKGITIDIYEDA